MHIIKAVFHESLHDKKDISKKYKYRYDGIITDVDSSTIQNLGIIYDVINIQGYIVIDLFDDRGYNIILDENNHGIIINKKITNIKRSFRNIKIYTKNIIDIQGIKIGYTWYTYSVKLNLGLRENKYRLEKIFEKAKEIRATHWQLILMIINDIRGKGISIKIPEYTLNEALSISLDNQW